MRRLSLTTILAAAFACTWLACVAATTPRAGVAGGNAAASGADMSNTVSGMRTDKADSGGGGMETDFQVIEREERTFDVAGVPRVDVKVFEGPVTVRAWDNPRVGIKFVKAALDRKAMSAIRLSAGQADGGVTVRADFSGPERRIKLGSGHFMSKGAYVQIEISVPRNSNLVVSTGDGPLSVAGVAGDLDLRTSDGGIEVSGGRGRLKASTNDGLVRVTEFEGEVEASEMGDHGLTLEGRFTKLAARAGGGPITLALPAGLDVDIETSGGEVVNEGLDFVEQGGGPGGTRRLRLGRGGNLFTLQSAEGRIILRRLGANGSGASNHK